jgi:hypothetical protein
MKVQEGRAPLLVLACETVRGANGRTKLHLVVDARPARFGVRRDRVGPEDLAPSGALQAMMRKHIRTAGLGPLLADPARGDLWLPLFTAGDAPTFWLALTRAEPPELRFIDATGTILMRRSSAGIYTKRRALEGPLPPFPPEPTWLAADSALAVDDGERDAGDERDADGEAATARPSERESRAAGGGTATAMPRSDRETRAADGEAAPWPGREARAPDGEAATAWPSGREARNADDEAASTMPRSDREARHAGGGTATAMPRSDREARASDATDKAAALRPTPSRETATAAGGPGTALLPEYQREARDRVARRLKTVRRSYTRLATTRPTEADVAALTGRASLLAAHVHLIAPGAAELTVEGAGGPVTIPLDPDASPGENLEAAWRAVKKARRADEVLAAEVAAQERAVAALEADLERLRAGPLGPTTVEAVLARHKLAAPQSRAPARPGGPDARAAALPFKTYRYHAPTTEAPARPAGAGVELRVGRGAAENDELVKRAQANDYWVHAVGTTGSHVLIVARSLGGAAPSPALVRTAAILALHYSRRRDERAGEVYFTRRHKLRKRKGMAVGLWLVEKAETLFVRYDEAELAAALALAEG